jgi:hypothetical protein
MTVPGHVQLPLAVGGEEVVVGDGGLLLQPWGRPRPA